MDDQGRLQAALAKCRASPAGSAAVKAAEAQSLSGEQIKQLLGRNIKITSYPDLSHIRDVRDILDSEGRGIVFFVESRNKKTQSESGHWTAIIQRGRVLEWFDSYGLQWDADRQWLSQKDLVSLHESRPLLAQLFERSGFQAVYNPYRFQTMSNSISTCGRHACVRLMNKDLDTDGYAEWMLKQCAAHGESPDVVVTLVTAPLLQQAKAE